MSNRSDHCYCRWKYKLVEIQASLKLTNSLRWFANSGYVNCEIFSLIRRSKCSSGHKEYSLDYPTETFRLKEPEKYKKTFNNFGEKLLQTFPWTRRMQFRPNQSKTFCSESEESKKIKFFDRFDLIVPLDRQNAYSLAPVAKKFSTEFFLARFNSVLHFPTK